MPTELMDHCTEMGVTVHQRLITGSQNKHQVERIAKQSVLTSSISMAKPWQLLIKRIVDVIGGVLLSIAAVIELLIVVPIIKTTSSGPVLLKQERIEQNGKKFHVYKFRPMRKAFIFV